ncbi:mitochondrial import inner membrane translocase subunit Tim9-like [Saccoglossus kowalevskii]
MLIKSWPVLLQCLTGTKGDQENIKKKEKRKERKLKFREFLLSYNRLSEMCFVDCVMDFTSRKVSDNEDSCTNRCMEKYLKMTQRISQRFQEYQVQQNENAIASQTGVMGR